MVGDIFVSRLFGARLHKKCVIMFVLSEIKDYIRIPPCNFHKPLKEAISEELNKKLANKVKVSFCPPDLILIIIIIKLRLCLL